LEHIVGKKHLARTAIEGGRHRLCRAFEHWETRSERQQARLGLHRIIQDRALADDVEIDVRGDGGRFFADKLGPVYRWMEKQVGRPWAKIYSEIRGTFDFRTTAGRHIVDHIAFWVNIDGQDYGIWRHWDFEIDRGGILRFGEWRRGRRRNTRK
jgi:hypothetical protein